VSQDLLRNRTSSTLNWLSGALFAALFLCSASANAELDYPDGHSDLAPLFASHAPLAVTIEAPLTTLMLDRPDKDYLEGTFSYTEADGTEQTFDLKIRTRGDFRRQKKICNFAPVRLNFRKKQVADTVFVGQDKLKLVTHCQRNRPTYEQYVLREYLAYRILQLMTNKSFGVRLMHINWVDTETGKARTKYGFVIEDDDDVADRIGMKSLKTGNVTHADLDPRQENLVNVFQYLIGNTDFSLIRGPETEHCCHNSKLLSGTDGPPYTPLPYDFDFAGLVDTRYSGTNPEFKLRSSRQRLYRGRCHNNDLLPDTFRHYLEKKDALYAIVDELVMFNSSSRKSVIDYLDAFYDDITDSRMIDLRFTGKCNEAQARRS
jgi:hypothetical protein